MTEQKSIDKLCETLNTLRIISTSVNLGLSLTLFLISVMRKIESTRF